MTLPRLWAPLAGALVFALGASACDTATPSEPTRPSVPDRPAEATEGWLLFWTDVTNVDYIEVYLEGEYLGGLHFHLDAAPDCDPNNTETAFFSIGAKRPFGTYRYRATARAGGRTVATWDSSVDLDAACITFLLHCGTDRACGR